MNIRDLRFKTLVAAMFLVLLSGGGLSAAFVPSIQTVQNDIQSQRRRIEQYRALLNRKETLAAEWERRKKDFHKAYGRPEEILNTWQQELMAYGEAEGLAIHKLEPAGLKAGQASVFLSFQANMKKCVQFLYYLMEWEPLVQIHFFSLRQEEKGSDFSFELILAKAVISQ